MITAEYLLRFHQEASLAICRHLHAHKALLACAGVLAEYMPVDQMYLDAFEIDIGSVRTIATATISNCKELDVLVPMPPAQQEAIANFRSLPPDRHVFRIPFAKEDPICRQMLHALQAPLDVSLMGTYPILDGKPIGAVVVIAKGKNRFQKHHAELFASLQNLFGILLNNALRYREIHRLKELLVDDNRFLRRQIRQEVGDAIVGAHFGLAGVMEAVQQVAQHHSPVLLLGETGVGKDVLANHIHELSNRNRGPMVKVNCGAIAESLLDSELFGHEKGAFTGALTSKRGRFERAHNGTIFLDEVAELSPAAQVRLLRVLQNKEIERIGGTQTLSVDVRVIAATHRNLEAMVANGRFRQDLWFRLNVFPILIPPLRARTDDIPAFVAHFLQKKSAALKLQTQPRLAPGALEQLCQYDWPGNVRELENILERALIINKGQPLAFNDLGLSPTKSSEPKTSNLSAALKLDDVIRTHIVSVLKQTRGRVEGAAGAANQLGLNPSTLRSRMKKLGIPFGRHTST